MRLALSAPLVCTLSSCLLVLGCSAEGPAPDNNLVGTWQCIDRPWTLKFTEDGQVGWKEIGPVFGGTYFVGSQGGIEVVLNNGDEFQASVQIEGNQELIWNGSDGTKGRFKRVR